MSNLVSAYFSLLAVVGIPFVADCGLSKPPDVLNWYTTTASLPTSDGQINLNPGEADVFLVFETQFPVSPQDPRVQGWCGHLLIDILAIEPQA